MKKEKYYFEPVTQGGARSSLALGYYQVVHTGLASLKSFGLKGYGQYYSVVFANS